MKLVGESFSDRERKCDRCKTRPVTCIFDRIQVCAGCYLELDEALLQEARGLNVKRKPPGRAGHAGGEHLAGKEPIR